MNNILGLLAVGFLFAYLYSAIDFKPLKLFMIMFCLFFIFLTANSVNMYWNSTYNVYGYNTSIVPTMAVTSSIYGIWIPFVILMILFLIDAFKYLSSKMALHIK